MGDSQPDSETDILKKYGNTKKIADFLIRNHFVTEDDITEAGLKEPYKPEDIIDIFTDTYEASDIFRVILQPGMLDESKIILRPVSVYDHSGVSYSLGASKHGWDSGTAGFVYITKEDCDDAHLEFKEKTLEDFFERFEAWAEGDIVIVSIFSYDANSKEWTHETSYGGYVPEKGYFSDNDAIRAAFGETGLKGLQVIKSLPESVPELEI